MTRNRTTKFYRDGMEVSVSNLAAEIESSVQDDDLDIIRHLIACAIAGNICDRELIEEMTGCIAVDEVGALR